MTARYGKSFLKSRFFMEGGGHFND